MSVVVVTINNLSLLRNCLDSLYAQNYKALELIVVDNGSEEDIPGMLAKEFPGVRLIRLTKNYGFAAGNNRGIEIARGKYVALINNDAVAAPQWISSLVAVAESDSRVGAVASIIIDGNRPDVLDSCGVGIALDGMSRQAMRGHPAPNLTEPKEVLAFSGCACLLRMEALKEVGLFDEDFFAYCEDTDLGLRLRWAGWEIVAAPGAYVRHYYSMTGGKFSLQKIYWVERNHFWVAIKNLPWPLLVFLPFVTVWRYLVQGCLLWRGRGELGNFINNHGRAAIASTYLRAYINMLQHAPTMFVKRWLFCNKRRLKDMDMLRLIWKTRLSIDEIMGIRRQQKRR